MPSEPVTPAALEPDLEGYVDFLTEVVETRNDPLLAAEEMEDLSTYYRALGICRVASEGDVDGFFHFLVQSALTRRFYLKAAHAAGGGEPRYRRASLLGPTFDAMAARQWRLAGELFALASSDWTPGEEYEDDFCYAAFVRGLALDPTQDLAPLLERWRKILQGASDPRLDVALSFASRVPDEMTNALRALLEIEAAKAMDLADPDDGSVLADELPFFPNHWVSVEALALLALAERQHLELPGPFRACPPLVRAGVFGPFRPRGFPYVPFTNE
jgi:hypothetical protein